MSHLENHIYLRLPYTSGQKLISFYNNRISNPPEVNLKYVEDLKNSLLNFLEDVMEEKISIEPSEDTIKYIINLLIIYYIIYNFCRDTFPIYYDFLYRLEIYFFSNGDLLLFPSGLKIYLDRNDTSKAISKFSMYNSIISKYPFSELYKIFTLGSTKNLLDVFGKNEIVLFKEDKIFKSMCKALVSLSSVDYLGLLLYTLFMRDKNLLKNSFEVSSAFFYKNIHLFLSLVLSITFIDFLYKTYELYILSPSQNILTFIKNLYENDEYKELHQTINYIIFIYKNIIGTKPLQHIYNFVLTHVLQYSPPEGGSETLTSKKFRDTLDKILSNQTSKFLNILNKKLLGCGNLLLGSFIIGYLDNNNITLNNPSTGVGAHINILPLYNITYTPQIISVVKKLIKKPYVVKESEESPYIIYSSPLENVEYLEPILKKINTIQEKHNNEIGVDYDIDIPNNKIIFRILKIYLL